MTKMNRTNTHPNSMSEANQKYYYRGLILTLAERVGKYSYYELWTREDHELKALKEETDKLKETPRIKI